MSYKAYLAAEDLSNSIGLVVCHTDTGVILATDPTIGTQVLAGVVSPNGAAQGEWVFVSVHGDVPARCGAALTPGIHGFLTFDSTSRVVPATPGTLIIGEWIGQDQGPATTGDLVDILISKSAHPAT